MSSAIATQEVRVNQSIGSEAVGVLIVSSNDDLRSGLTSRLQSSRWVTREATSGADALEKIASGDACLVLLDPMLPDLRVDEFREILNSQYPGVEIVPINSHTGRPLITATFPNSFCFEVVQEIERGGPFKYESRPSNLAGQNEEKPGISLPGLVGSSVAIRRPCSMARLVAKRDTTVLITGETGTGKDLVALALHELSPRRSKPFAVINCAAIPEALLEAELFGFVKGAFTGAMQSRVGRIHAAQEGTLFLDEIGDLPLGLQSKLLRFLEQGEVQRLGSSDTFRVDVRVIAATSANLRRMVQERNFREDLFYRLSVFPIEMPPLRERMEDLPLLTQHFLSKFCPHQVTLSAEAAALLQQHTWPGNVRELRNVVERASILSDRGHELRPEHIVI